MTAAVDPDVLAIEEWNELLHALRTLELSEVRLPGSDVLSVGCAGGWYFGWFEGAVQGEVGRHIGVEAFLPCPDDLPPHVTWIAESIGAGTSLGDATVDCVFAGQVIEHFWPLETVTFLTESWRVLRPGGMLVMDSPNRAVTVPLGWHQPEHTVELTVPEAVELCVTAGFDVLDVRGIWSCYDRATRSMLALEEHDRDRRARRIADGRDHPEDAFVWWIEARKSERPPDLGALRRLLVDLGDRLLPMNRARHLVVAGVRTDDTGAAVAASATEHGGVIRFGPYVPMPAGDWVASICARRTRPDADALPALTLEVVSGYEAETVVAERTLHEDDLELGWRRVQLPFHLTEQHFAVQVRVVGHPGTAIEVEAAIEVVPDRPDLDNARALAQLDLLEGELAATRARRSVRAADAVGTVLRRVRARIGR